MAAEMSTGMLAIMHVRSAAPKQVSMLVTGMEATFVKKAIGKTYFTCGEGTTIATAVNKAIETGEGVALTVDSTGRSDDGTVIAIFRITWSFKAKI
jgi:hypothetical protein